MADVGIRPLDLPEASAVAETDKIMVTNTAGATKVATAETLFKNSSKTICLTRAEYNALTEKKQDTMYVITDESVSGVTVDQTFNGSSANPQSGVAINGALTNLDVVEHYTKSVTKSDVGYSDSINVCNLEAGHTYLINCLFELTSSIDTVFVGMIYIGTERYYVRFNGLAGGGACISKAVAITSTKTLKCGFYNNVSNNVMCTFSFDVVKLK